MLQKALCLQHKQRAQIITARLFFCSFSCKQRAKLIIDIFFAVLAANGRLNQLLCGDFWGLADGVRLTLLCCSSG